MKQIIRNIKWKIQRARRGYADCDLWEFDEYLAQIIKEGCFILAEQKGSYPSKDGMTLEKWKQILLDMSFGFGSYLEMRTGAYCTDKKEFKELTKDFEKAKKLFITYFPNLWD